MRFVLGVRVTLADNRLVSPAPCPGPPDFNRPPILLRSNAKACQNRVTYRNILCPRQDSPGELTGVNRLGFRFRSLLPHNPRTPTCRTARGNWLPPPSRDLRHPCKGAVLTSRLLRSRSNL